MEIIVLLAQIFSAKVAENNSKRTNISTKMAFLENIFQ
jgi:hypothetical protein